MCLAKVYLDHDESTVFAQSVTGIEQKGNKITFMTIFGDRKTVTGEIESIDFTESVINVATK